MHTVHVRANENERLETKYRNVQFIQSQSVQATPISFT